MDVLLQRLWYAMAHDILKRSFRHTEYHIHSPLTSQLSCLPIWITFPIESSSDVRPLLFIAFLCLAG